MYDYNINDINDIIDNIEMQRYCMIARYNIEPNKIILGRKIYSILSTAHGAVRLTNKELFNGGITATIVGLPITVDHENIWAIEVCFELEGNARKLASLSR